jgi:NAD(P)-dependent dehydrogenase (short-subunit alcohol dehydrogenase family)
MGAAIANRLVEDGADVAISYAASAEKAEANVRQFEVKGGTRSGIKGRSKPIPCRYCCTWLSLA